MVIPWSYKHNSARQDIPYRLYIKRPWVLAAHDHYFIEIMFYQKFDTEAGLLYKILDAIVPLNESAMPVNIAAVPLKLRISACKLIINDLFINIIPTSFFNIRKYFHLRIQPFTDFVNDFFIIIFEEIKIAYAALYAMYRA